MKKKLKIGLVGFGVVGQGLYDVLQKSPALDAEIVKICVKNKRQRALPESMFCYSGEELVKDENINLVVELISDADAAFHIVAAALRNGKDVVSANKKMIAENLAELIKLQEEYGVSLLYEASACGSIPVIRNLEEYYDNDLLLSVTGILNGSSNYILSKIFEENKGYAESLKEAQELGFAEADPSFDVDGFDSLFKLVILTAHSFGTVVNPEEVLHYGISNISDFDIRFAREKGYKIKLVGQVEKLEENKISLFVLPRLVKKDKYIYNVEDEFNGVVIKGLAYDKQFMFGKGAGGYPTGSAVLSDITAIGHDYKYEYKKKNFYKEFLYVQSGEIEIYLRYRKDEDLAHFNFISISEEYTGPEYNYKIGLISIKELLAIKDHLREMDIFIAVTRKTLNY
ncbi:homoserine dehydrogenase [Saccharicrinis fermentans]|uniref:Homoserine dehydrogenase n=1 Tax=Saccharicrinis fermentans DSM 9555 = JCM 21142 TaxID=869213 RepID=W7YD76_9BACT|nr:homoserine dehydrogenase [Saccharicrinis fermentans]GAF02431.1 homoserine dehydrogenase [Saccharicrinis fermentans DSM 9555 = JCM 21142]